MLVIHSNQTEDRDRTEDFRVYAQEQAAGRICVSPLLLPSAERRRYVRQTLREDHQFRIRNKPEGAQAKFDKLAHSLFTFFRGTALLFYRDYAGMDSHLPVVFTIGDVHPENFGVMPNEDGAPFFGINDFDEAYFAPFSYDLKRAAVGFYIVAREQDFKKKKRYKIVRAFVNGYQKGLTDFARDDREKWHELRIDNSPSMVRELLKSAHKSRREFLSEIIDLEKERFVSSDEIVPHSKYIEEFQKFVDAYRDENEIITTEKDFFAVKDVAIKKGSGTASLGLDRYFVLINGPSSDPADNVILEFKQTRHSALYGLTPCAKDSEQEDERAARVVRSHHVHLAGGDPYYGQVEIDQQSFLVRERSPYKDEIDLDELDSAEMCEYATICGQTLAQTHARSDEDTGIMAGDAEKRILSSIEPTLFTADIVRFAHVATKRLYKDWKMFKKDHALGAFNFYRQA